MASSLYTLGDLRAAVYSRLENNSTFWQTPEVDTVINEAIRATNLLTGFYQGTLDLLSVVNQLVYATPAGMLYAQRVTFNNTQLDPIPITRIGQDYRTWATDTTTNQGAVARWIPIGINYFCLHPADSVGSQTISVSGVLEPPLLALPADTMILDDQYVAIIVEYCASRLPLKIGGQNFAQSSQLYAKGFQPVVRKLTNLQQFRFPRYWIDKGVPVPEDKIT